MKENYKTLLLAMLISFIIVSIVATMFFSSVYSVMEKDSDEGHGSEEDYEFFLYMPLIVFVGGFFSGTAFFYWVVDDWKKRKKS